MTLLARTLVLVLACATLSALWHARHGAELIGERSYAPK